MRRDFFRTRVLLISTIALTLGAVALAQYVGQVRVQLDAMKILIVDKGYEQTHEYVIDRLRQGQSDSFQMTLYRGKRYAIASVCDEDCSDIDITLYDDGGNLIALDDSSDSLPVVTVDIYRTSVFTAYVSMYSCYSSDCVYGIGIFGGNTRKSF